MHVLVHAMILCRQTGWAQHACKIFKNSKY